MASRSCAMLGSRYGSQGGAAGGTHNSKSAPGGGSRQGGASARERLFSEVGSTRGEDSDPVCPAPWLAWCCSVRACSSASVSAWCGWSSATSRHARCARTGRTCSSTRGNGTPTDLGTTWPAALLLVLLRQKHIASPHLHLQRLRRRRRVRPRQRRSVARRPHPHPHRGSTAAAAAPALSAAVAHADAPAGKRDAHRGVAHLLPLPEPRPLLLPPPRHVRLLPGLTQHLCRARPAAATTAAACCSCCCCVARCKAGARRGAAAGERQGARGGRHERVQRAVLP